MRVLDCEPRGHKNTTVIRNSKGPIRSSDFAPSAPRYARTFGSALAVVILVFLPTTFRAQISKTGATLEGTVSDSSGAFIQGASVHIRDTATGWVRVLTTDDQGLFRASELPVGTYELTVNHPGLAPYFHLGVRLTIGQTARLDIRLQPATQVEKITVSDQPTPINPSETTVTTTVGRERIEELPVRTRSALDFVLLAPGVAASNPQSPTGIQMTLAGSGFTFGGLRPRSNNLSIDGLDNNDEFSGGSRTELSPEIVREFQVINNGLSAEYGGASGGSIDVVTRTGENTAHGDAFIFLQNGALNARDPVIEESESPSLTRYRAGASRGGRLNKDRTFYFVALEQEHIRSEGDSDIDPGTVARINPFLTSDAFSRLATRRITPGFFPIARSETEASAKLNHQLMERNSLMLRYAFTNNKEASEGFNTSGLTDASARGSSFTEDNGLAGSLTSLVGSRAVNDLRFQFARRRVTLRTNDQAGPGVEIDGLLSFGRPYAGNSRHREDHYQLADTFTRTKGSQVYKVGGTASHVHINSFGPDGFGGVYLFPSLADFFAGAPDTFYQAFGNPSTAFGVTSYGAFLQDHWSLTKQMTLDLGLRYDFERLPSGFNQGTHNFSPRVGLAYSPSDRWVLRAGYGIFFDRYVLANLNRAIEKDGLHGFELITDGGEAAGIFRESQGGPLAQPLPDIRPSIFEVDPHLATPYSQQANFGIQLLLSRNLIATANYLFVRGLKLSRTLNSNLLPPTLLTLQNSASLGVPEPTPQQVGREVFGLGRIDPLFDSIYWIEDSASSTYHGLSVSLNRRVEDFTLAASYTVSKTIDDASDFSEQPQNPFDLRSERARSVNDQAQRFVLSGLFDLPFGGEEKIGLSSSRSRRTNSRLLDRILGHVELAPIVSIASGRPIDPLTGLDSNRGDAFPLSSRPLGFGRDTLGTPAVATVDLRIVKGFYFSPQKHLDLVAESFNLLNHTNVSLIDPFFGPGLSPVSGFRRPIDAFTARQIQFSIDLEY